MRSRATDAASWTWEWRDRADDEVAFGLEEEEVTMVEITALCSAGDLVDANRSARREI